MSGARGDRASSTSAHVTLTNSSDAGNSAAGSKEAVLEIVGSVDVAEDLED